MRLRVRVISSRGRKYVQVVDKDRVVVKSFGKETHANLARAYKYRGMIEAVVDCIEKGVKYHTLAQVFGWEGTGLTQEEVRKILETKRRWWEEEDIPWWKK